MQTTKVSKWGNSLAVRLSSVVVKELELKEGDQVKLRPLDGRTFEISKDLTRIEALEGIKKLARPAPEGFSFSRVDANER